MGGTWIHWAQANVWREALRYQMQQDLEKSFDFSKGVNHFELRSTHESITMSHKEEDELVASALEKFTNIDGVYGRKVIPLPCSTFKNPESSSLDLISAQDRIKEIANTLTPQERTVLEASILLASGGTLETTSFHEFMHWWAMCGYTYAGWMERLITWKFRDGQSAFAQRFFEEALATRRLSYAFNTPIKNIHDTGSSVKVTTRKGRTYRALRTISTVPLNVLSSITFDSPLSAGKQAAIALGHVNQTTKVHAEIANPELRSWTSVNYPDNKLNCAIGNGTTPAGNTHIVCFGGQHNHMDLEADIDVTKRAVSSLFNPIQYDADEITIERIVFHDWSQDKFAKGAWFFSPPGLVVKHLGDMFYDAVTESTPPPRPTSSFQQTPLSINTGSFANSTEHRKHVDDVLKEELGHLYVGIPGFFEAFFEDVLGLRPAAQAVFDKCREEIALSTGSTADRKLDIGFVDDLNAGVNSKCRWSQILIPGELKSNPLADKASKAWLDLGRYAREVLAAQDSRRFVLGFTLCGSLMRLWIFDRLGGITSEQFDINEDRL
ncbi:Monoamine oxidase N [Pyrenophora tritici-repentis]|nr:Monoamine oxidase N [Pyrenophora tritici-repentis]